MWRINEGSDGVLIGINTKVSRDGMYNAVQVVAQNAFPGDEPYAGDWVRDTDPTSPTRWGGPFGRKSIRITDPGIKYFDDMDPRARRSVGPRSRTSATRRQQSCCCSTWPRSAS